MYLSCSKKAKLQCVCFPKNQGSTDSTSKKNNKRNASCLDYLGEFLFSTSGLTIWLWLKIKIHQSDEDMKCFFFLLCTTAVLLFFLYLTLRNRHIKLKFLGKSTVFFCLGRKTNPSVWFHHTCKFQIQPHLVLNSEKSHIFMIKLYSLMCPLGWSCSWLRVSTPEFT